MKAGITILTDYSVQNYIRKIAYMLSENYEIPFNASLLPAHISLKQPFSFESLPDLEDYCDSLAAKIAPFPVELVEFYTGAWKGNGILGLRVGETSTLRQLHNRLNRELSRLFADTSAPHDGEAYRFHLTIEMGKIGETNSFLAFYESLPDKRANLRFMAKHIGLFCTTGEEQSTFILYKVIPITGKVRTK